MIYVSSDVHFFHKSIMKFCPESRPFSDVNEMNEAIVTNWNSVVGENDTAYILGDITFGKIQPTVEFLTRMHGTKILIMGNHDDEAIRKIAFRKCFDEIVDYKSLKYNGHHIYMFHYPIASWNKKHYGTIHLHGHLHGNPPGLPGRIKDVGMDTNNCMPYLLDDVIEEMMQIDLPVSHHEPI